jgi:hypothetical protein
VLTTFLKIEYARRPAGFKLNRNFWFSLGDPAARHGRQRLLFINVKVAA